MKYMGSKRRYARELLPIILEGRQNSQHYVEPFVGGFNMIDKVQGRRIASDKNKYLISLFVAIQSGWEPPSQVEESLYLNIKNNKDDFPEHLVGFIGFGCSYGGKWFGGFARGDGRNYADESKRNLMRQAEFIKGITIVNTSYDHLHIPEDSIIYCDPPYEGTTGYGDEFNHKGFWAWCEEKAISGNTVFVSEYNAPTNWIEVWSKKVFNSLDKDTGSKTGIEKLFTLKV